MVYENLKKEIYSLFNKNNKLETEILLENRYNRFRKIGAKSK
ncbi:MAG: hypothetical protein RR549_06695 [Oscillospiraceae bacterium]